MAILSSELLHATAIAIDGHAVLIEGRSGAGKSDLALRLIDRGAVLIADDRTICTRSGGVLHASAPATIAGRMEVRGIGILALPHVERAAVALIVTITDTPDRMPDGAVLRRIAGVDVRGVALPALEPSAPIKVELALRHMAELAA